ncbi:uncharacterized protein LOC123292860 [Chrysoperla carnea]|uniref:uncharacterized protein LOC123292860 n=1 Tax=Chrysoperla carnea TaxID=189513 RepID=UPI001D069776|nr:uncharacterized protein LOC123292860 [Chrysoperla carnea]
MSMKCRGKIGVLLDIFWTIGFMSAFAISLAYIPSLALHSADLRIASWRMFSALSGVLCIMASCVTALTFNSPRYLLMKRHFIEAKETLKHIYAINCSQHADNWPAAPEIDITDLIRPQFFNEERSPATCYEGIVRILKRVKILTLILIRKEYKHATYLLVCLKITLFPCLFTICILMSSVVKKLESVKYLEHTILSPNYMLSSEDILLVFKTFDDDHNQCLFEVKFLTFYLTLGFLLSATAGLILLYKTIEKFGRRKLLRISFFMCAVTSFAQVFSLHMYTRIIVSAVLSFFFAIAESILNVIAVESYPTRLRGTGNGFVHFFSAIVQGCMLAYLNLPCYVIFGIYSSFLIVGLILSSFVKDLRMKSMVE